MANNNVFIRCKQHLPSDENHLHLAKFYPATGYYPQSLDELGADLYQFMQEHKSCSLENENCFELVYEETVKPLISPPQ